MNQYTVQNNGQAPGRSKPILEAIRRNWEEGISLSRSVLFYLESGLGITGIDGLEQLMGQPGDPDRETVMELVLFPEDSFRLALEPLLGTEGLDPELEERIAEDLFAAHPRVSLRHPLASTPLTVDLSSDQAGGFVSRLYLSRHLASGICQALEASHPAADVLSARVLMRCTQGTLAEDKIRFTVRFVKHAAGRPGFTALFETFWALICDAPDTTDPGAYFLERQYGEKKLLRRIQKFQEDLARYGMEYLIMSKYQVPPESVEIVANRLQRMDTIITGILGLRPLAWD